MQIDADGTIVLSAGENQDLMARLKIPRNEFDDPPVEFEYVGDDGDTMTIKAINSKTSEHVLLEFELWEKS